MTFADDVVTGVDGVLLPAWSERDGIVVPTTDDIVLANGAVNLDATFLYADLADSSALGQLVNRKVAAKVVRAYLNAATRILKHYNGQIRSFDGDRVMAIFVGGSKNTNAVRSAFALNWAVDEVLAPKLARKWPDLSDLWVTAHGVGIDTGKAMLVRGGVRDDNDLIGIGAAPNVAAKLSEIRDVPDIYITDAVHRRMKSTNQVDLAGESRWDLYGEVEVAFTDYTVHGSNCRWKP